jgi:hypothetical protein
LKRAGPVPIISEVLPKRKKRKKGRKKGGGEEGKGREGRRNEGKKEGRKEGQKNLDMIVYVCNPSYTGGVNRRMEARPA